jgi:RNA polymerase sigma-70 factor (ECF subfamily)
MEHSAENQQKQARFEELMMPHLDAAYNLARWLTRNEHDARDVVQEAFLRAFKFFDGFHGTNSRAWLLTIVRNTAFSWLQKNRRNELETEFDEEIHGPQEDISEPLAALLKNAEQQLVRQAIEELPLEAREIMILRELEDLSYKEIAEITQVPLGTVMSRLARARKHLQNVLTQRLQKERAL